MQRSCLCRLQNLVADEGGAQEPIQRRGCPPLGVLQSCWDGVHLGLSHRPPAASCKGGWEGLGADEGRAIGGEGKLGRRWARGRERGQVGGGGGGSGPVACRSDAAGGKRLRESGSGRGEKEEVRLIEGNYSVYGQDTLDTSFSYLIERWKAELSNFTQLSIDVDVDQVLTKWTTARDVDYSH